MHLAEGGTVACGFMTKYFTPNLAAIAQKYFDRSEQSPASRKARTLILSSPKASEYKPLTNTVEAPWGQALKQYFGVFSSGHVDYASQFLIDNLTVAPNEQDVLDLEREAFLTLLGTKETQERIVHTLKTGKPLRN